MTGERMTPRHHLDDCTMARFLDDELQGADLSAVQAHVGTCGDCQTAVDRLRSASRSVRQQLVATDVAVPALQVPSRAVRPPRASRLLYAAIAAGLLFAVGITPVRAWVMGAVGEIGGRLFGESEAVVSDQLDPVSIEEPNRVSVSVPVVGNVVRIRLMSRQRRGRLTLAVGEANQAVAEVENGRDERLILSDGLVIANDATSTANYRIIVPANVIVEIVIANETARRFEVTNAFTPRELNLMPN